MATILVAAGGGGDAITAAALAAPLNLGEPVVIMTYSWDRLMIDPLPGPRAVGDFTRLNQRAPTVWEVTSHTRPVAPAGSSLPKSAGSVPGQPLLLDPSTSAIGTAEQITAAAEYFETEELVIVDVGGAALTTGHDPGLRSPDRRSTCHCRLSTHPQAGSADRRCARGRWRARPGHPSTPSKRPEQYAPSSYRVNCR